MERGFYAAFDERNGIVIGVSGSHSGPVVWFKSVEEFDKFLGILKKFRGTINYVPEAFRRAFDED